MSFRNLTHSPIGRLYEQCLRGANFFLSTMPSGLDFFSYGRLELSPSIPQADLKQTQSGHRKQTAISDADSQIATET